MSKSNTKYYKQNSKSKSSLANELFLKEKQEKASKIYETKKDFKESLILKKTSKKTINIQDFFSHNMLGDHFRDFKDASIECLILDYRLDVRTASYLKIPDNAVFPILRIERLNKHTVQKFNPLKKTSINVNQEKVPILNIREIETQTYASTPFDHFKLDEGLVLDYDIEPTNKSLVEKSIEDLIFYMFIRDRTEDRSNLLKKFILCLEKLSEESIVLLNSYFTRKHSDEHKVKDFLLIKSIVKLNAEKLSIFDILVAKLTKNELDIDLEKLIKQAQVKQKDVRFETSQEKKKASIDRFKRAVRFIMCNREWINQFNKEKVEEREKVLLDKYDNDFLDCKKIGLLFNKDEFRAQKSLNNLITDVHRNVLVVESHTRTPDQVELLLELVRVFSLVHNSLTPFS